MRLIEHEEIQKALGGTVRIGLVTPADINTRLLYDELWLELFRFEKAASRFLDTSELTRLNRFGEIPHSLSRQLRNALQSAQKSVGISGGLFNPFVLPAVQRAGYLKSAVDENGSVVADMRRRQIVDPVNLEVGDTWAKIPLGTAIDLGGCGKGHIVDELAAMARERGAIGGWVEASGDIFAWGFDAEQQPIAIAVQASSGKFEGITISVPIDGMGIATSGTFARPGVAYKTSAHHIIDPRTGEPAVSDVRLATVCAPSCLEADVLASTAIILGSDKAPGYLRERKVTDWILQPAEASDADMEVLCYGPHLTTRIEARHHA